MNVRADFPIFHHHPELVYLDSAATSQKPQAVIDTVVDWYTRHCASVHRGVYPLSGESSQMFEAARGAVAGFIGADPDEVIFTKSATEGLNFLATSLTARLSRGDRILISQAEHHANLIPWQEAARRHGLYLDYVRVSPAGEIDLAHLEELLQPTTKVVSLTHCSNVTGTVTNLPAVRASLTHRGSTATFVTDASQSAPHLPLSVTELSVDYLVFSGHKMYAPSGVGILWGRRPLLEHLLPYQTGGSMVQTATLTDATWKDIPWRFEAGTPPIEQAIGLGAAVQYLHERKKSEHGRTLRGMAAVQAHTEALSRYITEHLTGLPRIQLLGKPDPRSGIVSFTVEGVHPHDVAAILGEANVCVRAGHHCAAPLHRCFAVPASTRVSLGIYSTTADIDRFLNALTELTTYV